MHKNTLAFVIVAAIGGFVVGFWLANSINRSAVTSGAATGNASNTAQPTTSSPNELSAEEIRAKIADADENPTNYTFQKQLGISLYRYAATSMDVDLLSEAVRILSRADALQSKDFDVLVALGNAHFDIGFAKKDGVSFQTAREIYSKALLVKPGDADVVTDLGLTYFLQEPPAYDKAAAELQKVSDSNPRHERSLQFLVQVYLKLGKTAEAERTFAKLKSINPSNTAIPELTSLIASQTGPQK